MFCPRCGTENEEGDRFCVSCGASLRKAPEPSERKTLRERIRELIGTTPKSRAITAGTAIAIVVAIAAFIAIPAAKDSSDSYTRAADALCVQSKAQIEAVGRQIPLSAGPGTFAEALVPIIAGWRYKLNQLPTPDNHAHKAAQLDLALRGVEIEAGTLARASQTGASDLLAIARQGDQASAQVEDAIKSLDLSECQHLAVGLVRAPPSRR